MSKPTTNLLKKNITACEFWELFIYLVVLQQTHVKGHLFWALGNLGICLCLLLFYYIRSYLKYSVVTLRKPKEQHTFKQHTANKSTLNYNINPARHKASKSTSFISLWVIGISDLCLLSFYLFFYSHRQS